MPKTNQDPQGGVQASPPDLNGLLAELSRMANTMKAGGLGITQCQSDLITAGIHGTTRPLAAFALTPGQRQANEIIDYGTTAGTLFYEKATAALKHAFDHKEDHTVTLSLKVKERAEEMGWSTCLHDILTVKDSKDINRNLITNYGQLTLSDIKNSVTCYHLQPTGAAQNSEAFAKFLINTLAPHTKAEMYKCKSE